MVAGTADSNSPLAAASNRIFRIGPRTAPLPKSNCKFGAGAPSATKTPGGGTLAKLGSVIVFMPRKST
jgi:hypothetical protein